MSDVILRQEDIDRFSAILSKLAQKARLTLSILVHRDGHLLASVGSQAADTTSLAALVSANFASTIAIANIIGEKEFRTQFHRGKNKNVFVSLVDESTYMVSVFDEQTSIDIVRVYTEEYGQQLVACLLQCYANTLDDLDLDIDDSPAFAVDTDTPISALSQQAMGLAAPEIFNHPQSAAVEQPPVDPPPAPAQLQYQQPVSRPDPPEAPLPLPPVQPRALPHTVRATHPSPVEKPAPRPMPQPVTTETELARAAASISSRHANEIQYNPARRTDAPPINADYLKKKAAEIRSAEEAKAKGPLFNRVFNSKK